MMIAPKGIKETVAVTPSVLPECRPIGPHNELQNYTVPWHSTLEEHASLVTQRIEDELIKKFHVDHVLNEKRRSPYRGRAEGLVFKKKRNGVAKKH